MKRFMQYLLSGVLLFSLFLITSCSDDDEVPVDELVGDYAFAAATFGENINIIIRDPGTGGVLATALPANADAATFVTEGLFNPAINPCTDPSTTRLQLRADGTTWLVCSGSTSEKRHGSWQRVNNDLDLELTIAAENTSTGTAVIVNVAGIDLTGSVLTGSVIDFPAPYDTGFDLGTTLDPNLSDACSLYTLNPCINYQQVIVDITFSKTN